MPVTLDQLVANPRLGLRAVAGRQALHRAVSWVHVSELDDPTPFLDGGELLLTTGLGIGAGTDLAAFVGRLVARGLAGLGFGVGLSHRAVPAGLVTAADERGLPLLEVPHDTPFIAISKGVSAALAVDAYAEVSAANAAQQALTGAALGRHGAAGVVRRLAQLFDGWALLLDPAGAVRHATPAAAAKRVTDLAAEVDRLRRRGGPASASISSGTEHVVMQVLGHPVRGFLAVGRAAPLDRPARQVLGAGATVLTLALARASAVDLAQRRLRAGLLRLMLSERLGDLVVAAGPAALAGPAAAGPVTLAAEVAAELWDPPLPSAPVTVYAFAGPPDARDSLLDLLDGEAATNPGAAFFAEWAGYVVVLAEGDQSWLHRLPERVSGLHVGVSEPAPAGRFGDGVWQATQAVDAAVRTREPGTRFADLAGTGLLALVPGGAARAFAASLLAPLRRHDDEHRGHLVETLTEWLRHHGEWDPTAARLGVHRHTVRNRIRRITKLTGADLDDAGTRAELWFALRLSHRP